MPETADPHSKSSSPEVLPRQPESHAPPRIGQPAAARKTKKRKAPDDEEDSEGDSADEDEVAARLLAEFEGLESGL